MINKSIKFSSFFVIFLGYFLQEIENIFFVFLSSYRNTREGFGENSKKLWKHSPAARAPTAFLVLPNLHSCFYNSIETRLNVSYFLNVSTEGTYHRVLEVESKF